jgi:hypothetical protein
MTRYTLKDIQAASPGYPTAALECRIHPPCSVKLLFVPGPPERGHPQALWVTVTAMADGTCTGTLASYPRPRQGAARLRRSGDIPGQAHHTSTCQLSGA